MVEECQLLVFIDLFIFLLLCTKSKYYFCNNNDSTIMKGEGEAEKIEGREQGGGGRKCKGTTVRTQNSDQFYELLKVLSSGAVGL